MPDRSQTQSSDLEVMRSVAAGDRDAFAVLVERHGPSVRRLAASMVHNDAAADDVTQDALVAAWKNAARFRGEGSVRGWLLTITRNAARRRTRRRVGEPNRAEPLDELAVRAGWGAPAPDPDFERSLENRELLTMAFSRLQPDDREVLTLIDLEGLSLSDGAGVMEIGIPALKSRLHRARLRLLAAVQEVSS